MQLTRAAAYGLQGVLHLARQADNHISGVSVIAEAHNIPGQFLAKIFQGLAKAGVLRAHRGAKGGFSLRGPASGISVKDVVEAIDGPLGLRTKPGDVASGVWREVTESILEVLSRTTLADLTRTESHSPALMIGSLNSLERPLGADPVGRRAETTNHLRNPQHAREPMDGVGSNL
jgi:Rrf2 family protein